MTTFNPKEEEEEEEAKAAVVIAAAAAAEAAEAAAAAEAAEEAAEAAEAANEEFWHSQMDQPIVPVVVESEPSPKENENVPVTASSKNLLHKQIDFAESQEERKSKLSNTVVVETTTMMPPDDEPTTSTIDDLVIFRKEKQSPDTDVTIDETNTMTASTASESASDNAAAGGGGDNGDGDNGDGDGDGDQDLDEIEATQYHLEIAERQISEATEQIQTESCCDSNGLEKNNDDDDDDDETERLVKRTADTDSKIADLPAKMFPSVDLFSNDTMDTTASLDADDEEHAPESLGDTCTRTAAEQKESENINVDETGTRRATLPLDIKEEEVMFATGMFFGTATDTTDTNVTSSPNTAVEDEFKTGTKSEPEVQAESAESLVETQQYGLLERLARGVARWPKTCLIVSLFVATILSFIGIYFGNFEIVVENVGWPSRGTVVADRQTQNLLVRQHSLKLSNPNISSYYWEDLTTNIQPGWETGPREEDKKDKPVDTNGNNRALSENMFIRRVLSENMLGEQNDSIKRRNITTFLDECDVNVYLDPSFLLRQKLWPIWEVASGKGSRQAPTSATDPEVLEDLCLAEEHTQQVLQDNRLCFGCDEGCLPPYSIVLYARFAVPYGLNMNCSELAAGWSLVREEEEASWRKCIEYWKGTDGDLDAMLGVKNRGPCPTFFSPALVDKWFEQTGRVQYTSSLFVTNFSPDRLYAVSDDFDRGTERIEGAYDTQFQLFTEYFANEIVVRDTMLAIGGCIVTTTAMILHTRSPFLTFVGLFQIILAFPLSYFIYYFVMGLVFFPFLNLIGIFVIFALGADHVFVAVDKWKNARNDYPYLSTEDIAGKALPSAGKAMILTTITTAVAFFGSAICPIAPIVLFATFSGMLIVIDYILDVLVMFPCLCIYDSYRFQRNGCMDFRRRNNRFPPVPLNEGLEPGSISSNGGAVGEKSEDCGDVELSITTKECKKKAVKANDIQRSELDKESESYIRRLLHGYYGFLHSWRRVLLVLSFTALGVCAYFASTLQKPDTPTEIQLLDDGIEYEKNRQWRSNLLLDSVLKESGSDAQVVFGLQPADTGDHLDPYTWSTLVLDESFDPSTTKAQLYLRDFCESLFNETFAKKMKNCSMNEFDEWLQVQATMLPMNQSTIYIEHCKNATGIPIQSESFHACISGWAEEKWDRNILSWNGIVKVISVSFRSQVRFNSPSAMLKSEWHRIEDWLHRKQVTEAPKEVSQAFFSSMDFWWWDTTESVYQTAFISAAIAIAVSALVILVTSRSLSMTLFSAISVVYVLVSVTAVMKAAGWTLGFL